MTLSLNLHVFVSFNVTFQTQMQIHIEFILGFEFINDFQISIQIKIQINFQFLNMILDSLGWFPTTLDAEFMFVVVA